MGAVIPIGTTRSSTRSIRRPEWVVKRCVEEEDPSSDTIIMTETWAPYFTLWRTIESEEPEYKGELLHKGPLKAIQNRLVEEMNRKGAQKQDLVHLVISADGLYTQLSVGWFCCDQLAKRIIK